MQCSFPDAMLEEAKRSSDIVQSFTERYGRTRKGADFRARKHIERMRSRDGWGSIPICAGLILTSRGAWTPPSTSGRCAMPLERRYFSCIFVYIISGNPQFEPACSAAMYAAEQGQFTLVTSMLTMIEVIKDRSGPHSLHQEIHQKIADFFEHDYALMVQSTRAIMVRARDCAGNMAVSISGGMMQCILQARSMQAVRRCIRTGCVQKLL